MSSRVSLFTIIFYFFSTVSWAQQAFFPFLAEVKNQSVNVRAGQSANFFRVIQLKRGDEVIVIDYEYGWYKIQLPSLAHVYISAKYVQTSDKKTGFVTGNRVNIRPLPSVEHASVGQVVAGQELNIVEIKKGWVKIIPSDGIHGWIREDLLTFKSKTIPKEPKVKIEIALLEEPELILDGVVESLLKVQGYLSAYTSEVQDQKIYYQLTISGQPVYLIEGMRFILDDFMDYKVELIGVLDIDAQSSYPYPVISARSVILML